MYYSIKSLSAVALLLLLTSCSATQPKLSGQGYIHHVVVAWLKQPGNVEAQQKLIDATKSLEAIPGVILVTGGRTLPSQRNVVDASFDVALTVVLKNREALNNYQNDPLHNKIKKEVLKPLVKRYLVYNYED